MQMLDTLPPAVMLVLAVLLAIWLVLALLVPFMIGSIRSSARRSSRELEDLNDKLDRLLTLLEQRGHSQVQPPAAPDDDEELDDEIEPLPEPPAKASRAVRRRQEPTL
jgi:predicted PurR-regulated permease PerM